MEPQSKATARGGPGARGHLSAQRAAFPGCRESRAGGGRGGRGHWEGGKPGVGGSPGQGNESNGQGNPEPGTGGTSQVIPFLLCPAPPLQSHSTDAQSGHPPSSKGSQASLLSGRPAQARPRIKHSLGDRLTFVSPHFLGSRMGMTLSLMKHQQTKQMLAPPS